MSAADMGRERNVTSQSPAGSVKPSCMRLMHALGGARTGIRKTGAATPSRRRERNLPLGHWNVRGNLQRYCAYGMDIVPRVVHGIMHLVAPAPLATGASRFFGRHAARLPQSNAGLEA